MCGIFGFWLNRQITENEKKRALNSLKSFSYRGPDFSDHYINNKRTLFLGHNRLSILDLHNRSNQPMKFDENVIVYNGEIYNFIEIKKILAKKGITFQTNSDTEVLLRSVLCFKDKCFDYLDGMFSFALFDNQKLKIATDPFGEKPLYVFEDKDGIYFCSEARPLINFLKLKFNPTSREIASFLSLGFIPNGGTGYNSLRVIEPAKLIVFNSPTSSVEKKYWSINSFNTKSELNNNFIDDFLNILIDSIRIRMRSDVPIGVFLSSGIDSSLIAAICSRELKKNISSFTISFDGKEDESPNAKRIADYLNISNTVIPYDSKKGNRKLVDSLCDLYGVPNDNTASYNIFEMSKLAKNYVSVILSGIGGDEVAMGYNKYRFIQKYKFFYYLPEIVTKIGLKLFKSKNFINFFSGRDLEKIIKLKNNDSFKYLENIINDVDVEFLENDKHSFLEKVWLFDIMNTLPRSHLESVDRGSMRASMEIRSPFLSKKLFEKMCEIDKHTLLAKGQKFLTRTILKRFLPENLIFDHKKGFINPLQEWAKNIKNIPKIAGVNFDGSKSFSYSESNLILRVCILDKLKNYKKENSL
ncbi:MAG: asparagine synthase (glutamine-hydrolyzing) [Alphaproteobacteria bacterium]